LILAGVQLTDLSVQSAEISAGMSRGAQISRVHSVKASAQAVKVLWAVR
jgi:dihydropteroate synthase